MYSCPKRNGFLPVLWHNHLSDLSDGLGRKLRRQACRYNDQTTRLGLMIRPKRIYVEEMLDAGVGTDNDVAENLADLRFINRRMGGTSVVISNLERILSAQRPGEISLLDVGTGSADIPNAVQRLCRSLGISANIVALDLSERNLRIARARLGIEPGIELVQADALRLPFPDSSFDFVTASLFLHHFLESEVRELLSGFTRVARRSVLVNDLARSFVPYYFFRLFGRLFTRSYLTRNDGAISVLRGFTADELRDIASGSCSGKFEVRSVFPYRLSLVVDCASSSPAGSAFANSSTK
jgi:2-polyprenyl-3-methyl-5-hydroxy-6-metoxy-1,4-benzoquinol methylase